MADERNWGKGRGRRGRGRRTEAPDEQGAPGWNASAGGGSHGGGGGYQRGGYSQGWGPDGEAGSVHEGSHGVRGEHQGSGEGRWRGRGGAPDSWVGQPRDSQGGIGGENAYGRQPQSWRPEDDYTLSPARQAGRQGSRGPYTGRGPADYVRSDDRIREDVCDRLTEHGGIDATDIRVQVTGGEVTLEGMVEERVEKFMAEEVADTVVGVRDVNNRIRLRGRSGAEGRGEQR